MCSEKKGALSPPVAAHLGGFDTNIAVVESTGSVEAAGHSVGIHGVVVAAINTQHALVGSAASGVAVEAQGQAATLPAAN